MSSDCSDSRIRAFGMLLETHAALTAAVGRDLERDTGLALTWFEVLIRLERSPGQHLRMSDLASQIALSTSGLTRVIDGMEKVGLVERKSCPEDRRVLHAVLTSAGKDALMKAIPAHLQSLETHMVEPLGIDRMNEMASMLEQLRDASLH